VRGSFVGVQGFVSVFLQIRAFVILLVG
jgi:hypothetical protein